MKGEFYKMEYEAWDEGTDELTLEQEAAYLRVCHQLYRRGGSMPCHDATLARLWRCHPNKVRALLKALLDTGKLVLVSGQLTNNRVRLELDHRETQRTQKVDAGRIGGRRSGDVRRKPLENHAPNEADASSGAKQNEAIERRGEERRKSLTPPLQETREPAPSEAEPASTITTREPAPTVRGGVGSAAELRGQIVQAFQHAKNPNTPDTNRVVLWLDRGYRAATILAVIREGLAKKPGINSLAYFEPALKRAHEAAPIPSQDATSAERRIDFGGGFVWTETAVRKAVKRFLDCGKWYPNIGEAPDHPRTKVPDDIRQDMGVVTRELTEVERRFYAQYTEEPA